MFLKLARFVPNYQGVTSKKGLYIVLLEKVSFYPGTVDKYVILVEISQGLKFKYL